MTAGSAAPHGGQTDGRQRAPCICDRVGKGAAFHTAECEASWPLARHRDAAIRAIWVGLAPVSYDSLRGVNQTAVDRVAAALAAAEARGRAEAAAKIEVVADEWDAESLGLIWTRTVLQENAARLRALAAELSTPGGAE